MYYTETDFENGSRFMFFIKNISDTPIGRATLTDEGLYMICMFTKGHSAGDFCTFSINDDYMNEDFREKLGLSASDAEELQAWIENHKDEIVAQA